MGRWVGTGQDPVYGSWSVGGTFDTPSVYPFGSRAWVVSGTRSSPSYHSTIRLEDHGRNFHPCDARTAFAILRPMCQN